MRIVDAVLCTDVVAIYLFGSAVAGGLGVDSDVDLLAVTGRRLTDELFHALYDFGGNGGRCGLVGLRAATTDRSLGVQACPGAKRSRALSSSLLSASQLRTTG